MPTPRSRLAALSAVVALGLGGAVAVGPPAGAALVPPLFEQACGGTSWWAGSVNVCNGTVVYRDYVNDDHGADTGDIGYNGTQSAFGTLAHPAGDQRYP